MDRFELIRSMVEQVKSSVADLIANVLVDLVQTPIQQMMDSVGPGSDIWYGPGADTFVNDCTNFHIPETTGIQKSCDVIIEKTTTAVDMMDAADTQCRGFVDTLDSEFAGIVGNLV